MINEAVLNKPSTWYRPIFHEWKKNWSSWLVVFSTALTFVFIGYQIFGSGDEKQISFLSDAMQALLSLFVVVLSWRVTRHQAIDDVSRRAWRIISVSYTLYSFGHLLWFYYSSILKIEPFPSAADAGFWAFYPLMLWALLSFPTAQTNRSDRLKFTMDVAIVALGGTLAVWHFVIRPTLEKAPPDAWLMTYLNLSYIVGDLILLLGIATVLLRRPSELNRIALLIIVVGLLNTTAADIGFAYFTLTETYHSGHWVDNFFITGLLFFLVASHYQFQFLSQRENEESEQKEEEIVRTFSWLPYLGVCTGLTILLLETRPFWAEWLGSVIFASIGLTILVMLRQIAAVKENLRLLEEQTARKSELHFHTLIKDSSDITGIFMPDGIVKFISPSLETILGYKTEKSVGANCFDFVHPEDAENLRNDYQKAAEDAKFVFRNEFRYRHRDGSWRFLEGIGKAFYDAEDNFLGILQNSRDITDRKVTENHLRNFAAKLERSNRELQDFAYVASHDLQEPLRKVQAFGDRLSRKYSDSLGDEGNDYIRRMRDAAGRMQILINDLLTFSRVTTKAKPFQPTEMNKIVAEVVSDLEIRVEKTNGKVEVGELPDIDADPVQMRQLLQNLIGNALKFHKPDESPVINVFAQICRTKRRIT
ncbi:MAG TPA: PAS domain S-box protein, partial [Pyrinomonadaceae bacterium]|nr:PAS domain S-box protein [Pyrinomonadaceae bacterium]